MRTVAISMILLSMSLAACKDKTPGADRPSAFGDVGGSKASSSPLFLTSSDQVNELLASSSLAFEEVPLAGRPPVYRVYGGPYAMEAWAEGLSVSFANKESRKLGKKALLKPDARQMLDTLQMSFIGANPAAEAIGLKELPYKVKRPNKNAAGMTTSKAYRGVRYKNIYPGIDLVFSSRGRDMEFSYIAAPGADLSQIAMKFSSGWEMTDDGKGGLKLSKDGAEFKIKKPEVFQNIAGERRVVESSYTIADEPARGLRLLSSSPADKVVQFAVGKHDANASLVIDPVIEFSLLEHNGFFDVATAMTLGNDNFIYVTGASIELEPYTSALTVAKIDTQSRAVVARFHLPDPNSIYPTSIIKKGSRLFIGGTTTSPDLPIVAASGASLLQAEYGGNSDGFIMELSDSFDLKYLSYFGGNGSDTIGALGQDDEGHLYATGYFSSGSFPNVSGQPALVGNGDDSYLAKLLVTAQGIGGLAFVRQIGGAETQFVHALALDANGDVYVGGTTNSPALEPGPTSNAPLRTATQGLTPFVIKYNKSGDVLLSTYMENLGSTRSSDNIRLAVSNDGNDVAITGPLAFESGSDVFVQKLFRSGAAPDDYAFAYSFVFGGSIPLDPDAGHDDMPVEVAFDSLGNIYIAGISNSKDFPKVPATTVSEERGSSDAFLMVLKAGQTPEIIYSRQFGGAGADFAYSLAIAADGRVYVCGVTDSPVFDDDGGGVMLTQPGSAAFITRFSSLFDSSTPRLLPDMTVKVGETLSLDIAALAGPGKTFDIVRAPHGLALNIDNGVLKWSPKIDGIHDPTLVTHPVTVLISKAGDPAGAESLESFSINVLQ